MFVGLLLMIIALKIDVMDLRKEIKGKKRCDSGSPGSGGRG